MALRSITLRSVRCAIAEVKQRWLVIGWAKKNYYLEPIRASEGTLNRWFLVHVHWAHVVSYGPFYLCVIHKEGLWPSSGGINRLMLMVTYPLLVLRIESIIINQLMSLLQACRSCLIDRNAINKTDLNSPRGTSAKDLGKC
jgi:hypothetical protein